MENVLKIYSYNKCSTCRKAIAWLIKNNIRFSGNILFDELRVNNDKFNRMLELTSLEEDSLKKILDSLDVIPREYRNELLVQGYLNNYQ